MLMREHDADKEEIGALSQTIEDLKRELEELRNQIGANNAHTEERNTENTARRPRNEGDKDARWDEAHYKEHIKDKDWDDPLPPAAYEPETSAEAANITETVSTADTSAATATSEAPAQTGEKPKEQHPAAATPETAA